MNFRALVRWMLEDASCDGEARTARSARHAHSGRRGEGNVARTRTSRRRKREARRFHGDGDAEARLRVCMTLRLPPSDADADDGAHRFGAIADSRAVAMSPGQRQSKARSNAPLPARASRFRGWRLLATAHLDRGRVRGSGRPGGCLHLHPRSCCGARALRQLPGSPMPKCAVSIPIRLPSG